MDIGKNIIQKDKGIAVAMPESSGGRSRNRTDMNGATTRRVAITQSTHMAGVAGIEPAILESKSSALTAWLYPCLVAPAGLEPATYRV